VAKGGAGGHYQVCCHVIQLDCSLSGLCRYHFLGMSAMPIMKVVLFC
jgi:hypothetical protein